jgi:alpha-ketoglutarate-dependent taurine dioxygenase
MIRTDFLNEKRLPFVIQPENDGKGNLTFLLGLRENQPDFFIEKILKFGAVLLRGYKIYTNKILEDFVQKFSEKKLWNYVGGASPRREIGGKVYTSTEYPPHLTLGLHNELSYALNYPSHLYFCCETPAEAGGATTLGNSRRILQKINPEIVAEFKRKGVMYVRNLHSGAGTGYSWQDAFETTDKAFVEDYCRRSKIDFEWLENDLLRLRQVRPATIVHPETGEEVWFNQATGFHPSELDAETYRELISLMPEDRFRLNSRFGDGSPFDPDALNHIRAVLQEETVPVNWQKGDVLVLDNILTAHGRASFSGNRKILLAMT